MIPSSKKRYFFTLSPSIFSVSCSLNLLVLHFLVRTTCIIFTHTITIEITFFVPTATHILAKIDPQDAILTAVDDVNDTHAAYSMCVRDRENVCATDPFILR
uniref:Uncharacterized protein n=1 Tax=Ditylum brightwellii TaxID=49249 RepID=A0A6S9ADW7_9STRA